MDNKIPLAAIVILLAAIVGGGAYFFLNRAGQGTKVDDLPRQTNDANPAPAETPVTPQAAPTNATLSEQPDQAKYNEYLSDIYLGKMAIGKKIGTDGFPTKTGVFTAGTDLFCTMMTLKKAIPAGAVATAVFDTAAQQDNYPKTVFPMELKAGGTGGCSDLVQAAGKYEYKLYIDNVLAAVIPFEVK